MDEAIRTRLNAAVSPIGISGRPISCAFNFSGLYRAIADGSAGQKPVAESERVNERFERGTKLRVGGSECAIEFTLRIIATTDKSTNAAACVVNRHDRALEVRHGRIISVCRRLIICLQRMMKIGLALDFCELRLERLLRGILHSWIERRVNKESAIIDLILCQQQD